MEIHYWPSSRPKKCTVFYRVKSDEEYVHLYTAQQQKSGLSLDLGFGSRNWCRTWGFLWSEVGSVHLKGHLTRHHVPETRVKMRPLLCRCVFRRLWLHSSTPRSLFLTLFIPEKSKMTRSGCMERTDNISYSWKPYPTAQTNKPITYHHWVLAVRVFVMMFPRLGTLVTDSYYATVRKS